MNTNYSLQKIFFQVDYLQAEVCRRHVHLNIAPETALLSWDVYEIRRLPDDVQTSTANSDVIRSPNECRSVLSQVLLGARIPNGFVRKLYSRFRVEQLEFPSRRKSQPEESAKQRLSDEVLTPITIFFIFLNRLRF